LQSHPVTEIIYGIEEHLGEPLDIQSIVTQLKSELTRIGEVIGLLEGEDKSPVKKRVGRPPGSGAAKAPSGKGHGLTPAGRRKLSQAMKARWAQRRGPIAVTGTRTAIAAEPKPKERRKMSAAGRRNIAAAMKKRWAEKKSKSS
jgi:hypothetical protein